MKIQMTEKDKKLLLFLALFVIIVGIGYWGIYPNVKSIFEISDKKIEEEDKKNQNDLKISELPLIQTESDKFTYDINKLKNSFFSNMTNSQIDKYFTNLAVESNLKVYDLDIENDLENQIAEPYKYSKKAIKNKNKKKNTTEDDTKAEEKKLKSCGVKLIRITMKVGGSDNDIEDFVDNISLSERKIKINSFNYGEMQTVNQKGENYSIVKSKALEINMEFYMSEG